MIRSIRKNFGQFTLSAVLLVSGLLLLFPFYWLITSSLKSNPEILSRYMTWLPEKALWDNFAKGWKGIGKVSFTVFFGNTAFISVLYTVLTLFTCSIVAYGFARLKFKFKNFWFLVLLSTMMLPGQVTMIPVYLIWSKLKFVDTFVPLWSGGLWGGDPFYIFLLRQFIATIPVELDEAAICDGSSKFGIYWKIIMPLCKPALFTIGLFAFSGSYDNFFGALLYINSLSKYTIQLGLRAFVATDSYVEWGPIFAMTVVTMVPLIVAFVLTQRYLVQGISMTGIKG